MSRVTSESRIRDIALDEIDRSRNHRIAMPGDAERIEALKASIEACGQLQPVRVYERGEDQRNSKKDKPFILGFGARRCAAMELLGKTTVRAIVFEPASDTEIAQARAVENLHRQDITPLEEVRAVADVLEAVKADPAFTGDEYEEAATRLAKSVAWIKDRDYLHRLTKPVQRFAMRSGLPAGHLRELAKVGDADQQMKLACESVNAPSWVFTSTDKANSQEYQGMQEGFFAELVDGKLQRWPLSKLKAEVAKVQYSLKVIPWDFNLPVQHGDTKLRKCAGCPHNSETDRTLFGIDEDTANPRGYCLNASCYNAKQEAAQAAKEQVFRKIARRSVQTPEAIRTAAPDWLKESTVVGYVKRQLEKVNNGETESTDGKTRENRSYSGRAFTDHEKAVRKFAKAYDAWEQSAMESILAGINADAVHRVSWCVLLGVPVMWEHPRVEIPHISEYSQPCTDEPTIPELDDEIEKIIQRTFKGTRNGWMELLSEHEQIIRDDWQLAIPHPTVLQVIAECVGVKLPPVPQWTLAGTPETASQPEESEVVTA